MEIDYKELLRKYIDHVDKMEGTDFLSFRKDFSECTDTEWAAIQQIRNGS